MFINVLGWEYPGDKKVRLINLKNNKFCEMYPKTPTGKCKHQPVGPYTNYH